MASLTECRVRARKLGLMVIKFKTPQHGKYRYRLASKPGGAGGGFRTNIYCTSVAQVAHELSMAERYGRKWAMYQKLNGHRPKYGYKTVPRKSRKHR